MLFSIGNDFRLEKGIEEMLKCEVHAFDPRCDFFSYLIAFYEKVTFVLSVFRYSRHCTFELGQPVVNLLALIDLIN